MQYPTCTDVRVRSVADAHTIFYAVQQRLLPMVSRRLDSEERRAIRSGSVYVWEERGADSEATGLGIERWTDGIRWGPSRIRDEFLFYHEKEEPEVDFSQLGLPLANLIAADPLYGRKQRLVKQTYSVYLDTDRGRRKWHLIAYFAQENVNALDTVDDIPSLVTLYVPPGQFRSARLAKGRGGGTRQPPEHLVSTPSPPQRVHTRHHAAPYHRSAPPQPVQPQLWPTLKHDPARASRSGNKFRDTEKGVEIPPLGFIENTHIPRRCSADEWALRAFDIEGGLGFPTTLAYPLSFTPALL